MASKLLITPFNGSTTAGNDPTIKFQGTGNSTDMTLRVTTTGSLSFEGASGQLFSITDSMSGTIHSVNDVSGIPSIEVMDSGLVKIAEYNGSLQLGKSSNIQEPKLSFLGDSQAVFGPNLAYSARLIIGGSTNTTNTTTASINTTDGNLHLNAASAKGLFLNFYSGTSGITFGNGAGASVATLSSAGVLTAPSFVGPLTGNATTATALANIATTFSGTYPVVVNVTGTLFSHTAMTINGTTGGVAVTGPVSAASISGSYIGVNNTINTNGYGISLYGGPVVGQPTYGLMFQGSATFGTHGGVTGDWATYFTMNNTAGRGWIFKTSTGTAGNVASISVTGVAAFASTVTAASFNSITGLSSTTPASLGTAAVGTSVTVARSDHVHANPTLDSLSNTTITSNTTGEILKWNGSAWINNTLAEAGIQAAGTYATGTGTASGTNTGDNPGVTSVGNGNGMDFTTFSTTGTVTLGTPSTCTDLTTNALTTNSHTHAITGFVAESGDTMTGNLIWGTADRDNSPMGTYDATKTQQIWSMGAAYINNSAGTNFGTLYGAAYKHTNNTTGGTMAGGHQLVWCQAGVGTAAIGTDIWTSGNVTAYSDIRVKKNIIRIPDALNKVCQLSGYTFERTDSMSLEDGSNSVPLRQTGVIAQEVLQVLPEAVTGSEETHYSVAYGNMVGLLIEAIKEQQGIIEDLKTRLDRLDA